MSKSKNNQNNDADQNNQADDEEFSLGESDDFSLGESDDFSLGESDDLSLGDSGDSAPAEKKTDDEVDIDEFYRKFVEGYVNSTYREREYDDFILQGNINSRLLYDYFKLKPFQIPTDDDKQRIIDFCAKLSARAEDFLKTDQAKRDTLVDCIGVLKAFFTTNKSEVIKERLEKSEWNKLSTTIDEKCEDKVVEIDEMENLYKNAIRLGLFYDKETRDAFREKLNEEIKKRDAKVQSLEEAFTKWFKEYSVQNPKGVQNTFGNKKRIAEEYKKYKRAIDYINDVEDKTTDQEYIDNIEKILADLGFELTSPLHLLEEYIDDYVLKHNLDITKLSEGDYNAFKNKATDDYSISEAEWESFAQAKNIGYISNESLTQQLVLDKADQEKEKRTQEVANKVLELLPQIKEVLNNRTADVKIVNRLINEASKWIGKDVYTDRINNYKEFTDKVAKLHEHKQHLQANLADFNKQKRKKSFKVILILIILGVLGGGGFFGYKYIQSEPGQEKVAKIKASIQTMKENREQKRLEKQLEKMSGKNLDSLVFVEGGTFVMGSKTGDDDERPVHNVTLDSFYIGKHEVTQQEWKSVMGNNPSAFPNDNYPVEQVSWNDAIEYCIRRSTKENLIPCYKIEDGEVTCDFTANGYRLPTEAEWEYAAKGGNIASGFTYSGGNTLSSVGWYKENSTTTNEVMSKSANEIGVYDMSGNVWEWCWDWYSNYTSDDQTNPHGSPYVSSRVFRGGSWYSDETACTPTYRGSRSPETTGTYLGFRIVRSCPDIKGQVKIQKDQVELAKQSEKEQRIAEKEYNKEQKARENAYRKQRIQAFFNHITVFEKISIIVAAIYFVVLLIIGLTHQTLGKCLVWFILPAAALVGGAFLGAFLQGKVNKETFALVLGIIGAIIGLVGGIGGAVVGLIVGALVGYLLSAIIFVLIPVVLTVGVVILTNLIIEYDDLLY